jgi:hypothetical protein
MPLGVGAQSRAFHWSRTRLADSILVCLVREETAVGVN